MVKSTFIIISFCRINDLEMKVDGMQHHSQSILYSKDSVSKTIGGNENFQDITNNSNSIITRIRLLQNIT